jgi:hypothetical protein
MRQAPAQRLIRAEQERLERGNGTVQNFCNGRVIHAFILVHQNRRELLGRQAVNGVANFPGVVLGQQLLIGTQSLIRHLDAAGIIIEPRVQAQMGGFTARVPTLVVMRNSQVLNLASG